MKVLTRFHIDVNPWITEQMTKWRNADAHEWDDSGASNRAWGFQVDPVDLKAGLVAGA